MRPKGQRGVCVFGFVCLCVQSKHLPKFHVMYASVPPHQNVNGDHLDLEIYDVYDDNFNPLQVIRNFFAHSRFS